MARSCNLVTESPTTMRGWDPITNSEVILRFSPDFNSYCAGHHPTGILNFRFHPDDMPKIQAHVAKGGCISFHWRPGFTISLIKANWFKS
jgi:hypothetical protein